MSLFAFAVGVNACPATAQQEWAAWGRNDDCELNHLGPCPPQMCPCPVTPPTTAEFTYIARGNEFSIGLTPDGTLVHWGSTGNPFPGSTQLVPVPPPPTDDHFVAVSAGWYHAVALTAEGEIIAWGHDEVDEVSGPNEDGGTFRQVHAGEFWTCAIRSDMGRDGQIAYWGFPGGGKGLPTCLPIPPCSGAVPVQNCSVLPPPTWQRFTSMSCSSHHCIGRTLEGEFVGWGHNSDGQCSPPANGCFLDYLSIEAGHLHNIGFLPGGFVHAWGSNNHGQATVPQPARRYLQVATEYHYNIAIRSDGKLVHWGQDPPGVSMVPLGEFWSIPSGDHAHHVYAMRGCWADCNRSGTLTAADFTCFQNAYAQNQAYGDCDADGDLDVDDHACYQNKFLAGCP